MSVYKTEEKDMEQFDEIWLFIEEKLKISIPAYIKNILQACGFNNGITIASIDEEDMQYFVTEVKKGNVKKFFNGNEKNILEGTAIPAAEFEFTRGHRKLILSIVDFLKKHIEENGPDNFMLEVTPKKKTTESTTKKPGPKTRVASRKILNSSNTQTSLFELSMANHNLFPNANLKIHEGILISKSIMNLIDSTPELYCENVELIKKKISSDLVGVRMVDKTGEQYEEESKESVYEAEIACPYCIKTINVFHKTNVTNRFLWNTSNFDRHLKKVHQNKTNNIDKEVDVILPENSAGSIETASDNLQKPKNQDNIGTSTSTTNFIPSINSTEKYDLLEDLPEKNIAKVNFQSIVFYSDSSEEDDEQQQILTASSVQDLKSERNKIVTLRKLISKINGNNVQQEQEQQSEILVTSSGQSLKFERNNRTSSIAKINNFPIQEAVPMADQTFPKPGDYVICSSTVKSSVKWPANKPIVKHFVGHVRQLKERVRNKMIIEEIEIQFLKKSPYSKLIFKYPEKIDINQVPRNEIVNILKHPSRNRRGEFVFEDKFLLDYTF